MTLHTIGDSHAWATFVGMPGVSIHHLGPITMKRAGHLGEDLVPRTVAAVAPPASDSLLFSFGEIDLRCWVKVWIDNHRRQEEELLLDWSTLYLDKLASIATPARKAVLGVPPPAPKARIDRIEFPVAGTDAERISYNRTLNHLLEAGCAERGFAFANTSMYADADGMLRLDLADASVHIANTTMLRAELSRLGLLP